jgi:hypothetical protein
MRDWKAENLNNDRRLTRRDLLHFTRQRLAIECGGGRRIERIHRARDFCYRIITRNELTAGTSQDRGETMNDEVNTAAYHFAGHAVATYVNGENNLDALSIAPDNASLWHIHPRERKYDSRKFWLAAYSTTDCFELAEKFNTGPSINYQNRCEEYLAGEAAEIIFGSKKNPDWRFCGYTDFCAANMALFTLLGIPCRDADLITIAVPAALKARNQSYAWELLDLYFDFSFRRVTLKLKHNWHIVETVAEALEKRKKLSAVEVEMILDTKRVKRPDDLRTRNPV